MTKSQTETPLNEQQKKVAYRTIEAPVTYQLVQPDNDSHAREYFRVSSKPSHYAVAAPPPSDPYIEDPIPRSEPSHHSSRAVTRSNVEGVTSSPTVTKISVIDSGNSRASYASSHVKTARQSDFIPVTEVRSAKDVPLPHSRVTSLATEGKEESKAGKSSVSPKESVSQVSTRRSGESGRSKHYSGRNVGRGKDHEHRDYGSRTSEQ